MAGSGRAVQQPQERRRGSGARRRGLWEPACGCNYGDACEDGALDIGNASLSLPALPCRWLPFPTRSQDFPCCSLLGSHPVGKGERWREAALQLRVGDGDGDPSPGTPRRGGKALT